MHGPNPEYAANFERNARYQFPFIKDNLLIGKFCATALPDVVLQDWQQSLPAPVRIPILPDGCRDLIFRFPLDAPPHGFVSSLHDGAEWVDGAAGDRYVGYRLRPEVTFDAAALLRAVRGSKGSETAVLAAIDDLVRRDMALAEALTALAEPDGVAAARKRLGVSERKLERLVANATGRPPAWWHGLARARNTAAALAGGDALAAIAADAGYADQAHMNRAFRRWFGTTPGRLRACPSLREIATAPGYAGAPTGVQSSTRNPSGSAT